MFFRLIVVQVTLICSVWTTWTLPLSPLFSSSTLSMSLLKVSIPSIIEIQTFQWKWSFNTWYNYNTILSLDQLLLTCLCTLLPLTCRLWRISSHSFTGMALVQVYLRFTRETHRFQCHSEFHFSIAITGNRLHVLFLEDCFPLCVCCF